MNKKKILIISDHALYPSGVGVQSRLLIEGLLSTNKFTIIQLGAAVKHASMENIKVKEDFYIKPIEGFGNENLIRSILLNEKPEAIIIFSDPRFFEYLFKIEDEIHQVCPIVWWHVWDNNPYPDFNKVAYDSVDLINCLSYLTYDILSKNYNPEKVFYIPHSYPTDMFFKFNNETILKEKIKILGIENKDSFVCLWVNRNIKRKRPNDLIKSWAMFLDKVSEEQRKKCILLMHTNPDDIHGYNLRNVIEYFKLEENIFLSTSTINLELLNTLYNISDFTINISFNEGFGLTTLESMMTQTPIIAVKTGGLTRQIVDYRDNTVNGIDIDIDFTTVVGNQKISYLNEDYASCESISNGILKAFNMEIEEKSMLGKKAYDYSLYEFNYKNCIKAWENSLLEVIEKFNDKQKIKVLTC